MLVNCILYNLALLKALPYIVPRFRNILDPCIVVMLDHIEPGKNTSANELLVHRKSQNSSIKEERNKLGFELSKPRSVRGFKSCKVIYGFKDASNDYADWNGATGSKLKKLVNHLLDKWRPVFTNNWHTSISWAERLREMRTHLICTVSRYRIGFSNPVIH